MADLQWFLILNGKAAGREDVREAVETVRNEGQSLAVRVTWEPGDEARYVGEAVRSGARVVIAGGGDGTLNAVACALADQPGSVESLPALAVLPLGTANDFAHGAGIPLEPLKALHLPLRQAAIPVDLLRVDGDQAWRWCINLASGGFGTRITSETSPELKKRLGGAAYVLTGLARLGQLEPLDIDVQAEGFHWQGGLVALGLGNGRQAGGGQAMCPEAVVDDGLIDIIILPEHSSEELKQQNVGLGTLITEGAQGVAERLSVRTRSPWLQLESAEPFTLNLDGEPLQARRFRVECVPGRLRVHLPAGSPLLQHSGN